MSLEHSPAPQNQALVNQHPLDSEMDQEGTMQRSAAPPLQLFSEADNATGDEGGRDLLDDQNYLFVVKIGGEDRAHAAENPDSFAGREQIQGLITMPVPLLNPGNGAEMGVLQPNDIVTIDARVEGNYYAVWASSIETGFPGSRIYGYVNGAGIRALDAIVPEETIQVQSPGERPDGSSTGNREDWSEFVPGTRAAEPVGSTFEVVFPDGDRFTLDNDGSRLFLIGGPVTGMEGYYEAHLSEWQHAVMFYMHRDNIRMLDGEPLPEGNQPKGQNHSPNSFAVVQQPTPLVALDNSETVLADLPVNTSLFIEQVDEFGWLHVRTDDGQVGRVNKRHIHGEPPAPGSNLYRIQSGDNLEGIFQTWFQENGGQSLVEQGGSQAGDPRYFANVVMQLNNPDGEFEGTSVYLNDDFHFLNLIQNYQQLEVRADYYMWLPSPEYYMSMIGVIAPGSIHGNVQHTIKETLDRFWPIGFGLMLDGSLGATFGIPVGLDGELGMEIVRTAEDELQVRRRFSAWGGADTGVSASAFFGSGRDVSGTDDKQWGVGASAGANARGGVRLYGLQEYSFPMDDRGVIAALMAVSWSDTSPLMQGLYFIGALTQFLPNPQDYFTKQKMQAGLEGNAEAVASAGIRAGTENYASHSRQNPEGNFGDDRAATVRPGGFIRDRLIPMLQLTIGARYDLSITGGIETEVDPENPDRLRAKWFGEFVSVASAPGFLAPLFALIPGGSVGQTSYWSIDQSDPDAEWEEEGNSFKVFSGQLDYYQGAGSEMEIFMEKGSNILDLVQRFMDQVQTGGIDLNDLFAMIANMQFTNRFNLPLEFGGGHFASRKLQQGVERLLPREYQNRGFALNGYFTVKYGFRPSLIANEMQSLVDHYKGKHGNQGLLKVYQDLQGWLLNGEENEISTSFTNIARGVVILDAQLRAEAGLSVAAGAAISAGGKGRLQGHLGGGILFESNITDLAKEVLQENFEDFNLQFIMQRI